MFRRLVNFLLGRPRLKIIRDKKSIDYSQLKYKNVGSGIRVSNIGVTSEDPIVRKVLAEMRHDRS